MIKVFAEKVWKTGFVQKAGFPSNSERIFGIYPMFSRLMVTGPRTAEPLLVKLSWQRM
jgi:hypothetical protein